MNTVHEGSGNVFADLGFPEPEDLRLRAELTRQICKRLKRLRLTQGQAAKRMKLKPSAVASLSQGRHSEFSADQLMMLLNALEVDVEIVLRPRSGPEGQRGTIRVLAGVGSLSE